MIVAGKAHECRAPGYLIDTVGVSGYALVRDGAVVGVDVSMILPPRNKQS